MDIVSVAAVDAQLEGSTNVYDAALLIHLKDSMFLVMSREDGSGTIGIKVQIVGKGIAIQSRSDNSFRLLDVGRIRWCTKPKLDTECCAVQLILRYRCPGGIAFLGKEFAIPVSALGDGCVGILLGFGLGLGHTSGKADLGLPSADAGTIPELIVESQGTKELGYPR